MHEPLCDGAVANDQKSALLQQSRVEPPLRRGPVSGSKLLVHRLRQLTREREQESERMLRARIVEDRGAVRELRPLLLEGRPELIRVVARDSRARDVNPFQLGDGKCRLRRRLAEQDLPARIAAEDEFVMGGPGAELGRRVTSEILAVPIGSAPDRQRRTFCLAAFS